MSDMNESRFDEMSPPVAGEPPELAGKQSTWPTVVGVISIVLGSLGILVYGCGSVANLAMGAFSRSIDPGGSPQLGSTSSRAPRPNSRELASLAKIAGVDSRPAPQSVE